jgi:chromosome partitioning protein
MGMTASEEAATAKREDTPSRPQYGPTQPERSPASVSTVEGATDQAAPPAEQRAAGETSTTPAPQPPGGDAGVGWFSTEAHAAEPEAGQFGGTLSKRLSAERPGDEPSRDPVAGVEPPSRTPGDSAMEAPDLGGRGSDAGDHGPDAGDRGSIGPQSAADPTESSSAGDSPEGDEPTAVGASPEAGRPVAAGEPGRVAGSLGTTGTAAAGADPGVEGSTDPRAARAPAGPGASIEGENVAFGGDLPPGRQEPGTEAPIERGNAAFGTGLVPGRLEPRSPELIEAGMVYVDPDPEIGSPPRAAGWTERPPEGSGSHEGSSGPTNAAMPEEEGGGRQPSVRDVNDSATTEERGTTSTAEPIRVDARGTPEAADEPGPTTATDPGLDEVDQGGTGEAPAASGASVGLGEASGVARGGDVTRPDRPGEVGGADPADRVEARDGKEADSSTGSVDAARAASESTVDHAPWTEPALPMAWPPGMAPSDREESSPAPSQESDPADGELAPEPDPSWPRLFGRSSEGEDIGITDDLSDARQSTGPPLQLGREWSSEQAAEHPDTQRKQTILGTQREERLPESGGEGEPRSSAAVRVEALPPQDLQPTSEIAPAGDPSVGRSASPAVEHEPPAPTDDLLPGDGEQVAASAAHGTDPPPIVDITTEESESEREPSEQSEHGRVGTETAALDAEALSIQPREAGVDVSRRANISTVVGPVGAEEVDLRAAPASPPDGDVSRETSADGGGVMDPGREDEALEDEAAIAVRDAVSRAAAEAGVDVSRETDPMSSFSIDEPSADSTIDTESAARNARVTFRIHREALNGSRRVLAVANQKGGVGKSTTAVNIGAYLALAGARVLVIDLDPQGNASTGLGLDHRDIEPSIYDVLTGEAATAAAIRATGVPNLHVLPSTIDLAGAEVELVSAMSRETRLRRALQSIDHLYDMVLIDCPPSLGLLTVNALAAADELLIPIQCEYYALEGLGQLLRNVELVRANLNPELRIGGIVLTMYDGRTRLALQVVEEVRKHFTDVVYQTVVPRSVRLSEAPGYGLPIALYDPLSRGGIAYRDLTYELAERSGLLAPTAEGAS